MNERHRCARPPTTNAKSSSCYPNGIFASPDAVGASRVAPSAVQSSVNQREASSRVRMAKHVTFARRRMSLL